MISIHAPRMGSDYPITITPLGISAFQSTLPGWGATICSLSRSMTVLFQSTLPGWGATRRRQQTVTLRQNFNPRSPDGERLQPVRRYLKAWLNFNPRSPDGERPDRSQDRLHLWQISIHAPRMGSDRPPSQRLTPIPHFNPRSPDGERPTVVYETLALQLFQSTLPGWGATTVVLIGRPFVVISIHAPRMGSDYI